MALKNLFGDLNLESTQQDVLLAIQSNKLTVTKVINDVNFDLNVAPYSNTYVAPADALINRFALSFSSSEPKTITILDTNGETLVNLVANINQKVDIDAEELALDEADSFTIQVTQTAGPCLMNVEALVTTGNVGLTGNATLSDKSFTAASTQNSSNVPLAASATFTGTGELNNYPELGITCFTDQPGELYVDFSTDGGVNYDSTLKFDVAADRYEIHRLVKGPRTVRVRFINTSSSAQTVFRLFAWSGEVDALTTPLNSTAAKDADATIVRTIPPELDISLGRVGGFQNVNKFGFSPDIDASVTLLAPADIWNGTGQYTGFPTGDLEEALTFVSSDPADTGSITFFGLRTPTSTFYESETVQLTGTTPVNTASTWWRVNRGIYNSGNQLAFNTGIITCRHVTTATNVFFQIPAQYGQTTVAAYTVPYKNTGIVKNFKVSVNKSNTAIVEGTIWIREPQRSPRRLNRFTASNTSVASSVFYTGIKLSGGTDITLQVHSCSANNVQVSGDFDIVLVEDRDL